MIDTETKTKLLIIGNARHGKDTVAEILNEHFEFYFQSSSQAAADIFLYDALRDKYGYDTPDDCFEDRVNHRAEWFEMITAYNQPDRTKLARAILEQNDCYVGMRNREEIAACIDGDVFDLIIWVDACERLPKEDASSFDIDPSCADIIIDNNGTLDELISKVVRLGNVLGYQPRD